MIKLKHAVEVIVKSSAYKLFMSTVFPETKVQQSARELHSDCRCGFCIEKAAERGVELKPAVPCSMSLGKHKVKCGEDGNAIYLSLIHISQPPEEGSFQGYWWG